MTKVWKLTYRKDGALHSLAPHRYAVTYLTDGTLVKPVLDGSLLFGFDNLEVAKLHHARYEMRCVELWLGETTGPLTCGSGVVMAKAASVDDRIRDFWAGDMSWRTLNEYTLFPDIRLLEKVQ